MARAVHFPAPMIPPAERNRAVRILAKSIYRQLTEQGYDEKQIVTLATELIGAVTRDMQAAPELRQ